MEKVKQHLNLIFCIDDSDKIDLGKDNYELALKIALEELEYYKEKNPHTKLNTYDSTQLISIEECQLRFDSKKEHRLMDSKWRIWYNAWLEGRALMLSDVFHVKSDKSNSLTKQDK